MPGKKGQILDIPDIKIRIDILYDIFGKEKLLSNVNTKTVEKWRADKTKPTETVLKRFLEPIKMTKLQFTRPLNEFSHSIMECFELLDTEDQYTHENVIDLIKLYKNQHQIEMNESDIEDPNKTFFLSNTIKHINPDSIENDFYRFKGFYYYYAYWETFDEKKIAKRLLEIYDFNKKLKILKFRLAYPNDKKNNEKNIIWEYEGQIFKAQNQLFWLYEANSVSPFFPEICTIHVKYPKYSYYDKDNIIMYGIVTAMSSAKDDPCSTRVVIKKISNHSEMDTGKYYSSEETEKEDKGKKIIEWINNKIEDHDLTLVAYKPKFID